jgi:hypothetical protein
VSNGCGLAAVPDCDWDALTSAERAALVEQDGDENPELGSAQEGVSIQAASIPSDVDGILPETTSQQTSHEATATSAASSDSMGTQCVKARATKSQKCYRERGTQTASATINRAKSAPL